MANYMLSRRNAQKTKIDKITIQEIELQEPDTSVVIPPVQNNLQDDQKLVEIANGMLVEIYSKIKSGDFSNPISIITQAMEIVEKIKGLSGEDKKNIVIIAVNRLNDQLSLVTPGNLEGIIDTICYISKFTPKINIEDIKTKLKSVLLSVKNAFTCSCFKAKVPKELPRL